MIIYVYLLFHKAPQIIKIVILVNLSPIFFGTCTVNFGMKVWQVACLSNSIQNCTGPFQ